MSKYSITFFHTENKAPKQTVLYHTIERSSCHQYADMQLRGSPFNAYTVAPVKPLRDISNENGAPTIRR